MGGGKKKRNRFSYVTKKPFRLKLEYKTTLFTQYLSYLNSKGEDSSCKIDIYGYLYIKTKMGVTGLILGSHPPNFENQYATFEDVQITLK